MTLHWSGSWSFISTIKLHDPDQCKVLNAICHLATRLMIRFSYAWIKNVKVTKTKDEDLFFYPPNECRISKANSLPYNKFSSQKKLAWLVLKTYLPASSALEEECLMSSRQERKFQWKNRWRDPKGHKNYVSPSDRRSGCLASSSAPKPAEK